MTKKEDGSLPLLNLSQSESKIGNDVKIFPNPTNGIVKMIASTDIEGAIINIKSILGGNEKQFSGDKFFKNELYQYDISDLPSGIYIISVISNDKVISYHKINKL